MTSIEQIARQYRGIRCNHIAQSLADLLRHAEANEVSYLAFAESLVTEELQRRNRMRIDMNRRKAAFPVDKRLVEFDYRHQSTITKRQVNQLLDFRFIDERANLVFIGPPGVGKTHLAIGIGQEAQASLRSRERFWDIRVPKIDSIFDNSLVPRPSWSPGVPPQHRKLVAATHRSPI